MGKKILLIPGHSRSVFKWGMIGEVVMRLQENPENETFYLDCNHNVKGLCGLNAHKHFGYCKKCSGICLPLVKLAGLDDAHILKMSKFKAPKFPKLNSIQESIDFSYEGYNFGLGPTSCVMTLTRDYDFDIKKWQKTIHSYFETEYTIFKNLEMFFNEYHFDEIHTFNGRMPSMYPVVSFAQKNKIPFVVYERGANIHKLRIIQNGVPHDFNVLKNEIKYYWENKSDNVEETAQKWFIERRAGKFQALESFTKNQLKDSLPKNWNTSNENIVFFNSSIDEVAAFESWEHPFAKNENEILENLFEHYKNDENKHFYLRIHPNLTEAKKKHATQIKQINEMKKKYKNLTVIEPDDKIDTYALMEACDKVLSTYSTTAIEATYWGKAAIIAGIAPYDNWNCVYQAKSMEELYDLIDTKDLKPKAKENTYPYGYYLEVYGDEYKYFKPISHTEGYFKGVYLKDK